jgi:hypothetical protein
MADAVIKSSKLSYTIVQTVSRLSIARASKEANLLVLGFTEFIVDF